MAVRILYVLESVLSSCYGVWHGTAPEAPWCHAILNQLPQAPHTPLRRLTKGRGGSNPHFKQAS